MINSSALNEAQKQSNIGNANYYNEADGKYYEDEGFTVEANNNTKYLQELFSNEKKISIPEGNFFCKEQLCIKGKNIKISGVKGRTKISFAGNTANSAYEYNVAACIVNDSHKRIFDENSAQNITVDGISFELKQGKNNAFKFILVLANVNGGNILNCRFVSDKASDGMITLVDLFCCCKNIKIKACSFENMTGADKGSCIWVRNLTNSDKDNRNATESISISNCNFKQDSDDEIMAVYSSRGNIRNIEVEKCEFKDYSDNNAKVLSTYPSENSYCGTVDNIKFFNNKIYSEKISNYTITVGGSNRANAVSNVVISGNEITIDKSTKDSCKIIYINDNDTNIENVFVRDNIITAEGQLVNTTAVYNATCINDNTVTGELATGICYGKAYRNIINGSRTAIASPETAENNIIYRCGIGISCDIQESRIAGNVISLDPQKGICGIEVKDNNSLSGYKFECSNNKVVTSNEKQYGFAIHNGDVRLVANILYGPGTRKYESGMAKVTDIA
ncbi:hypothetical protein [Ruminiclostridium sufflavum]|nr:hypothetical protein [Ruminiclostridium sufflavum]